MKRLIVAGTLTLVLVAVAVGAALLLDAREPAGQEADEVAAGDAHTPASAADPDRPEVLDTPIEHFDGRVVRLADWSGTPMVVNFWASWCPPCVAEMSAAFEPVHQAVGDEVAFVGLNVQDDPAAAAEIVEVTGVTYDLARDPDGEMFAAFGGFGMPTTVFVDAAGAVVETHTGALSRAQLEQLITRSFGLEAG